MAKSRESVLTEEESRAQPPFTFQGEVKEDVKKSDGKKKFKLKFPKNKLAQISRAIRSRKTKKQEAAEVKGHGDRNRKVEVSSPRPKKQQVKELCKNALDSIDSLEQSLRQLEISMDSFGMDSPSTDPFGIATSPDTRASVEPQRKRSKAAERGAEQLSSSAPPDALTSPRLLHRKRPSSLSQQEQLHPASP
ncbi:unnamed protein product [Knipowitschia caucasica]|uniref:Uncharacterized protein n=1 Tax=Knipowitschia caucasica TaxID=637954 RepID=A0AAV2JN99_KNICA